MSTRLTRIHHIAADLYHKPNSRIDWNAWMWQHVEHVALFAEEIALREGANVEESVIGAYLHDIAFAWMRKDDPDCDEASLSRAVEILVAEGFDTASVDRIVYGIIEPHGCHERPPASLEGKVLSTADAMAHLMTDFYLSLQKHGYLFEDKSEEDFRQWALQKIDRDYFQKIQFEEERMSARSRYEELKVMFQ